MEKYEIEHLKRLRKIAPECMVLLKKDGSFPLENAGKIALYGSGARHTVKGGTGSGDVNSRNYVTVEEGLENAGFEITTAKWLNRYDEVKKLGHAQFIKNVKAEAKKQHTLAVMIGMGMVEPEMEYDIPLDGEGDTAIYVLARNAGEGNDRKNEKGDLQLTDTEVRDILALNEKYEKFMLVLNVGNVVDLSPVKEVKNILVLSQLGAVTGDAFADVLLGKSVPSGKLTSTWGTSEDIADSCEFGGKDDTRYNEGIYVGYRYYDSFKKTPVFPFGHGLSYTDYEISEPKLSLEGTVFKASVKVKNVGAYKGKEILEMYVTAPWGMLDNPYQKFVSFVKTPLLSPGETAEITMSFDMKDMTVYDEGTSSYIVESGAYIVRLGLSSRDTKPVAVINLAETVVARILTSIGGKPDFKDMVPEHFWADENTDNIPSFVLLDDDFDYSWPQPAKIKESTKKFVTSMSDEELSHLVVGAAHMAKGIASVIGGASVKVAGAAGENCDINGKVYSMVMADGPAGLRLSRKYGVDKKGKIISGGSMLPEGLEEFMPPVIGKLAGGSGKIKGEIREQYCTAIPIGTALAQSYNSAVCMECGDIVGKEMEIFGVDLWLAPAFNIHRSTLCGRNFEYCSEDPILSALVACGITNGVQMHKGKGVTVKHFCVNNQETNRYQSNSIVSERALREIYIKAFENVLVKAKPAALMTSYNLLNGVHTSEREDLLKTFLRDELGYEGLVMTDWVIGAISNGKSAHRMAIASASVKAGNDIFMPGAAANYKDVVSALSGKNKEVKLTREEIEFCAAHIYETSLKYHC